MTSVRDDELEQAVNATNALTAAWCDVAPPGEFVLSGAGAWPLLALLEAGASGQALEELRAATGVEPADASTLAVGLMTHLGAIGVDAALALWIRAGVPINASWATELPTNAFRDLPTSSREALAAINQWASEATKGRITEVDVEIHDLTAVVLASALRTSFSWEHPFGLGPIRWLDREVAGLHSGSDLREFGVIEDREPIARFVSRGDYEIDVHLLAGSVSSTPADVLQAGIDALANPDRCTSANGMTEERDVNGLRLVYREATRPYGTIEMPAFTIRSDHDLLEAAAVFGLSAATSPGDHFPGISSALAIGSASQQAVASFQAAGFEASAVTVMAPRATSPRPSPLQQHLCAEMVLDRPFGFLVVHRQTRLVVFAGWVTTPVPPEEPEEPDEFRGRP